jgi:hypothetical protein
MCGPSRRKRRDPSRERGLDLRLVDRVADHADAVGRDAEVRDQVVGDRVRAGDDPVRARIERAVARGPQRGPRLLGDLGRQGRVLDRHDSSRARQERPHGEQEQVQVAQVRHDHVGPQPACEPSQREERPADTARAEIVHDHVGRDLAQELAALLNQAQVQLEALAREMLQEQHDHALGAAELQARDQEQDLAARARAHGTRLIRRPGT